MGKEAEILIGDKNVRNGTYLFRWSQSRPDNIVLSVNWKEQLGHIPIEYKVKEYLLSIGEGLDGY